MSVNNFAIRNSIYKDNNNKFKIKLVKAFRNMHLQYYNVFFITVYQYSIEDALCENLLLIYF